MPCCGHRRRVNFRLCRLFADQKVQSVRLRAAVEITAAGGRDVRSAASGWRKRRGEHYGEHDGRRGGRGDEPDDGRESADRQLQRARIREQVQLSCRYLFERWRRIWWYWVISCGTGQSLDCCLRT